MTESRLRPDEVGPTEDGRRLRISWGDGTVAEYEPFLLRCRCPCASCVDEMTGIRILQPHAVARDVFPEAIQYVGRYALHFRWSDGHDTGIYSFELLRRLGDEKGSDESEV